MDSHSDNRRSTRFTARISRRAPTRMLGFALVTAVIFGLLAPLAGEAATVAADDPIATEEAALATEEPVDDPVDDSGEGGEVTPTAEVTTQDEVPNTSGLYLTKLVCDSDYGGDLYQLLDNCELGPGYEFEVYGPNYQETFKGGFSLSAMPSGAYTIREYVPAGFGDPIAFCGFGPSGVQQTSFPRVQVYEGYYEFALDYDESVSCYWFNIQYGEAAVRIQKRFCPDGFDAYSADIYGLTKKCQGIEAGVRFGVYYDPNGTEVIGQETDGGLGMVTFEALRSSTLSFAEPAYDGYGLPIVLCKLTDADGNATGYESQSLGQNQAGLWFFTTTLGGGDDFFCQWYNVPLAEERDDEHDDELADEHADGTATIYKYFCEEPKDDFDPYRADRDELLDNCEQYHGGEVGFDLYNDESGETQTRYTSKDEIGAAFWESVPGGDLTITEYAWDGYGTPVIYCSAYDPTVNGTSEYAQVEVAGDGFDYRLEKGWSLECAWFNIPEDDDDGEVVVKKWVCPEGYDYYDRSLEELYKLCDQVLKDVAFHLTDGEDTRSDETDDDGLARWDGVGSGENVLLEEVPDGYGEPIVYCSWDDGEKESGPKFFDLISSNGNPGILFGFDGYGYLYCDWFNVPDNHGGSITIYKWLCPEGFDFDAEGADPREECDEAYDGVEFEIDGPDGYDDKQETGDDIPGGVQWKDLEDGAYEIEEDLPRGIAYGFVLECAGGSFPERYPLYTTESRDPFEVSLEDGQDIVCDWFNVPDDDSRDDSGKLTIIKYRCDGARVSDYDCELYGGGQAFVLRPVGGGDEIELTTGRNGKTTVEAPEGAWELEEVGAEWCKARSADVNRDGDLLTYEGHETIVKVYNCGDDSGNPPSKTPTQLPNTGSGETAETFAIAGMTGGAAPLGLLLAAGRAVGLAGMAARRLQRPHAENLLAA